ncbi:MAG: hypothetical protein ACK4YF_08540, partial [Exilispira sp.]
MAKDINKILKTIEHFGEGTFDEIEQLVQSEQSVVSSIDKDVLKDITGEESSLDIDIDSILKEDLKSFGIQPEEGKEESIEEPIQVSMEEQEEEKHEKTVVEEHVELPSELSFEGFEEIQEEKKERFKPEEEINIEGFEEIPLNFEEKPELKGEEKVELPEEISFEGLDQFSVKKEIEKEEEKTSQPFEFESFDLSGLEDLSAGEIQHAEEYPVESISKIEEFPIEEEKDLSQISTTEEMPYESAEKVEEAEIPEEFIDLSLAASGIPFETEVDHEKPHTDYSNIEISDEDIHIIINTLKNYPPWLSNEIKNLILNDALSLVELEGLIDLLSNNVPWKAVMEYLKNSLNIDLSYHLTPEEKVYIPTLTEKLLPYIKW